MSKRMPVSSEVVNPEPYFKVKFECSNRAFYDVKQELFDLAESIDIEIQDGYITEECDYEGDLERIIIYNGERGKELIRAVCRYYEIIGLPEGMNIVLSIF